MIKFIIRSLLALGALVFLVIFGVRSCSGAEYPRPSEAFYVSDFADMFGPRLENFLISESEDLYETYKDEPEIGGIQIVVTTVMIESEDELGNYDKNAWFNEWQVGKKGMGVLVILYFLPLEPFDAGNYSLTEVQIETGDKIAEYMGTIRLYQMLEATIQHHVPDGTPVISYDYDLGMGVATLMNELLNVAYGEIYDKPEYVMPQAEFEIWYEDYFDNSIGGSFYNTSSSISVFNYFFSSYGSIVDKLLFGTFIFAFTLASGVAIKGGGGSSLGAGIFRHRR